MDEQKTHKMHDTANKLHIRLKKLYSFQAQDFLSNPFCSSIHNI